MGKRLPFTIKQGELLYKDRPIKPRVCTPTPRDLLKLTDPELDQINQIRLIEGGFEEQNDSTFRGYAVAATDHDEVNKAYKKMKLMHGEASHIACAYYLQKMRPPIDQDGCDDYEHGASRVLLQAIHESGMKDIAVFMVRYFGGKKLGPARFDLMKKVAESALTLLQVSLQEVPNPSWDQQHTDDDEESTHSGRPSVAESSSIKSAD